MTYIHTRQSVSQAWERYSDLVKAVDADPIAADDPAQKVALARAHERWSQAFIAWDGK